MTASLFLLDPGELVTAVPGTTVSVGGPEGRHAVSVQRLRVGEEVLLADGAGRRVRGRVSGTRGKDTLEVEVGAVEDEPALAHRLVLVQALAKGGRDEQAVESAVELGVDEILPWRSARCVSVWEGPKIDNGRRRWADTARAAAKQSRRAVVPTVLDMVTTGALATWVASVVAAGGAVLVAHEEATAPLLGARLPWNCGDAGTTSGTGSSDASPTVAVVVGPEGGITAEEVARLEAAGAQTVRLGPHVLRTSTAGPVALALLAQAAGRWA